MGGLWDVSRVYVEEGGREDSALRDSGVYDACFGGGAVVGGVCLSASEVVGDEFDNGGWDVCVVQFLDEKCDVHCVEGF